MSNIHTKTAVDSIVRSPFQAIAAVFVLGLTFFVGTLFSILVYSSNQVLGHFETRPQVIAFLKEDASVEDISKLQSKLLEDARIKEVQFVSKEEALSIYKEATSDNPLLAELVSPSIFPASLEFSLSELSFAEEVIGDIRGESLVEQVGFTANLGGESSLEDVVTRLKNITRYVRIGGGVLAGVLAGASFLVLIVIIGMRIATRKGEIEILDLIGATSGFIRSPIMLEAIIYSVVGVLVGWVLALILVLYSTPSVVAYFGEIPVLPKKTQDFLALFGIILAIEMVLGVILALLGSSLAVARARKKR